MRQFIDEDYARDLYGELTWQLVGGSPVAEVYVAGSGVHWRCATQRGEKLSVTHCFDTKGPEYLTCFHLKGKEIATGRTNSKQETMKAIEEWLDHADLNRLYARFEFVDKDKRRLVHIRDTVIARVPELASPAYSEFEYRGSGIYALIFRGKDRHCKISFYGNNKRYDGVFFWDKSEMFRIQGVELNQFALILKHWIWSASMPSQMRVKFPWLEFKKVADYYEQGKPIEGDFMQSWDFIETFFEDLKTNYRFNPQVSELLIQMRDAGYDRTLRAGQSMTTLILSRSRHHGMSGEGAFISFDFSSNGMHITFHSKEKEKHQYQKIALTPSLNTLLDRLVAMGIDEP